MIKVYGVSLNNSFNLTPPKNTVKINYYNIEDQYHNIFMYGIGSPYYSSNNDLTYRYNSYVEEQLSKINYNFTENDLLIYQMKINSYNAYLELDPNSSDVQQQRQAYFAHASIALSKFLIKYPNLAESLSKAAGYGIFQATNFNLLFYTGGFGTGIIFDNVESKVIYARVFRAGTGLGLGYINDSVLVVFNKHFAIEQYFGVGGKGADVGASASIGVPSAAVSFDPVISIYQLYNYGVNFQANWGATLYWSPEYLNK